MPSSLKARVARIFPGLPPAWRHARLLLADALDFVSGRRLPMVPPRRKTFIGTGDFVQVGERWLALSRELAGLRPGDRVLDVGCGQGRYARALTRYLDGRGSYHGFDAVEPAVRWCREEIARRYPQFHFQHADLYNGYYNPKGTIDPSAFEFPFPDESFDLVVVLSVFTHVRAETTRRYLSEIGRVLRREGTLLASFFLINDAYHALAGRYTLPLSFPPSEGPERVSDPLDPEAAVAYDERWVREQCRDAGLSVKDPIRYGGWCFREEFLDYQDLVIATRSPAKSGTIPEGDPCS